MDQQEDQDQNQSGDEEFSDKSESKRKSIHLQKGQNDGSSDDESDQEEFYGTDDENENMLGDEGESEFTESDVFFLEEKRGWDNTFEVIPEGWIEIRHDSGMPIYLHRQTRVCSVSKPYFLGTGSARKHSIPVGSIPCLAYTRAKEKEMEQGVSKEQENISTTTMDKNEDTEKENLIDNHMRENYEQNLNLNKVQVESAQENSVLFSLDPIQFREYCQKVFEFKTVTCKKFKTWDAKKRHTKESKLSRSRPSFPDNTQLITFTSPIKCPSGTGKGYKDYTMNLSRKTPIMILHEYANHALKKQPVYEFKELENSTTPFSCTILIDNLQYGKGFGASKKRAKVECAKMAVEILLPKLKGHFDDKNKEDQDQDSSVASVSIFDHIKMDDKRIESFCLKVGEPAPYGLLRCCLQRNFGLLDCTPVELELISRGNQSNRFKMCAAGFEVEVQALNKKEGKQLASQALLTKIHPELNNLSSFLRLYGHNSVKTIAEKKQEEREITSLQSRASANSPNEYILNKLRKEMLKLSDPQRQIDKRERLWGKANSYF